MYIGTVTQIYKSRHNSIALFGSQVLGEQLYYCDRVLLMSNLWGSLLFFSIRSCFFHLWLGLCLFRRHAEDPVFAGSYFYS